MAERFISEAIRPEPGTFDTARMAAGEPGVPGRFTWRGETVEVVRVLESWRDTGPCRHGSGEQYVRKHWYRVATRTHGVMKLYFERQPRGPRPKARWWLFSVESDEPSP